MKKHLKLIEMIFCAVLVITVSALVNFDKSVETVSGKKYAVVIDAGHGTPDGGASGKSGVLESEINLKVSKYIEKKLKEHGIAVIMTRSDENALYTDENASVRDKKREDMRKRRDIINESGAELAVSIHMNYFGIKKYSGPQLFCPSGDEKSYIAAEQIKKSLLRNIGSHCTREIKKVDGGIFLLKNSEIPIVLAECGFLSNEEEEKLLITDDYCKKMGDAIAEGIFNYLKSKS